MLEMGFARAQKHIGEFGPGVRRAHVNDPHGLNPWPGRLDAEQARRLTSLNAAPELLFRGQQEVLVERVGGEGDLHPFAAAGDDRKHACLSIGDPHVVLQLRHVLFGRPSSEKLQGSMNLASKTAPVPSIRPSSVAAR